jgi:hypothetical protein
MGLKPKLLPKIFVLIKGKEIDILYAYRDEEHTSVDARIIKSLYCKNLGGGVILDE